MSPELETLKRAYTLANARWERFIARGIPSMAWIKKSEALARSADAAWTTYRKTKEKAEAAEIALRFP